MLYISLSFIRRQTMHFSLLGSTTITYGSLTGLEILQQLCIPLRTCSHSFSHQTPEAVFTLQCVVLIGSPILDASTTVTAEASSIVNPLRGGQQNIILYNCTCTETNITNACTVQAGMHSERNEHFSSCKIKDRKYHANYEINVEMSFEYLYMDGYTLPH